MPNSHEYLIAWAAGLFEGEGSFSICNHGVRMQLTMNDKDVVEKFAQVVGCGTLCKDCRKFLRAPGWRWQTGQAKEVFRLISLFRPYLGSRRLKRAAEIEAWAKENLGNCNPELRSEHYARRSKALKEHCKTLTPEFLSSRAKHAARLRLAKMTAEQRSELSRKAAKARWERRVLCPQ